MSKRHLILSSVILLWLVVIAYAYTLLIHYELKPSSKVSKLKQWPSNSHLDFDSKLATLVIFVHPRCPCTKASIAELDRLLTSFHNKLKTIVVFTKPKGETEVWLKGALWDKANSLTGVTIYIDNDNYEAHNFKVDSSGEVLLFDNKGQLIYHGGITASRGHEGDNKGKTIIANYLRTGIVNEIEGYAFGCTL